MFKINIVYYHSWIIDFIEVIKYLSNMVVVINNL